MSYISYIYETHLHTQEVSACGQTQAIDYIDHMKSLGYSGIVVTDHFFTGNCAVPKTLPWNEKVDRFCRGYELAHEAAIGKDFTVLFGLEYNFQGDEFLIYGVDKKWILENSDIEGCDRYEVYKRVHQGDGIMIQAHPYRERGYLSAIHLTPDVSDGAEAYNASNPDWQNALGYQYAKEQGLKMTGGSDIHYTSLDDRGGLAFPEPVGTIQEFKTAFMEGKGVPVFRKNVHSSDTGFAPIEENSDLTTVTQPPTLEVFWH